MYMTGAILPNGEINFDCPCLGNMPNGPCGLLFRDSFTCWVKNKDDDKTFVEKCKDKFISWEACTSQYKSIYHPEEESKSKAATEATGTNAAAVDVAADNAADVAAVAAADVAVSAPVLTAAAST